MEDFTATKQYLMNDALFIRISALHASLTYLSTNCLLFYELFSSIIYHNTNSLPHIFIVIQVFDCISCWNSSGVFYYVINGIKIC